MMTVLAGLAFPAFLIGWAVLAVWLYDNGAI